MDLASSICIPRAPACLICPIRACCEALRLGMQEELPVLEAKAAVPHYTVTAAVIQRDGQVLIARRPSSGLLGGMWEFPGGKVEPGEELPQALQARNPRRAGRGDRGERRDLAFTSMATPISKSPCMLSLPARPMVNPRLWRPARSAG